MENEARELFERIKSTACAAGDMARQGLDLAGKKTCEAWGTAKLRWKLSELRFEARLLYCELGKSVYMEHTAAGKPPVKPEEVFAELPVLAWPDV